MSQTRQCWWLQTECWTLDSNAHYSTSQSNINVESGDLGQRWKDLTSCSSPAQFWFLCEERIPYKSNFESEYSDCQAKNLALFIFEAPHASIWLWARYSCVCFCPRGTARSIHLIWTEIPLSELFVFSTLSLAPSEKKNVFKVNNKWLIIMHETENQKSGHNGHPWGFKLWQYRGINCLKG